MKINYFSGSSICEIDYVCLFGNPEVTVQFYRQGFLARENIYDSEADAGRVFETLSDRIAEGCTISIFDDGFITIYDANGKEVKHGLPKPIN